MTTHLALTRKLLRTTLVALHVGAVTGCAVSPPPAPVAAPNPRVVERDLSGGDGSSGGRPFNRTPQGSSAMPVR